MTNTEYLKARDEAAVACEYIDNPIYSFQAGADWSREWQTRMGNMDLTRVAPPPNRTAEAWARMDYQLKIKEDAFKTGPERIAELNDRVAQLTEANQTLREVIAHQVRHGIDDYQYTITSGPRKNWDLEPDLAKEGWEYVDWERFEYHEEITWRRKREVSK